MTLSQRKSKIGVITLSGMITFTILIILFAIKGLAPFGDRSLVVMDGDIQYLDFFSYYKDVLIGNNSIGYSFGKTLGGSNIAVFSYYLSSPFNLLLIFFGNAQLHTFFDLVVALKLSLSAMTFAFFAINRFDWEVNDNSIIYLLTSIGYGLCQYNIAQSSNIMWLDGVYMLPLILLQISNIVAHKKFWSLPLIVGSAIIFNWYSAGIDCVFSAVWFLFEFALHSIEQKATIKNFIQSTLIYVSNMILGVLVSAALFIPTIGALKKSTRGSLHFGSLMDLSFLGEFPSAIQKYTYGATSELGSVALFCGSITIVFAMAVLFYHGVDIRKRILFSGLLGGSLLIFYWNPLYTVFSLFQWVSSYHYRYSYVSIFSILFISVIGYHELNDEKRAHRFFSTALIFSSALIFLYYCKPINDLKYVYLTALSIALQSALVLIARFSKVNAFSRNILFIAFGGLFLFDIAFNANCLINYYSIDGISRYQSYREGQENTISTINLADDSLYRISQTTTRNMGDNGLTANYNEGLSYNYASISGYTSSPDDNQREFLNRLGYPINGENMCITNTSILGADSLLGVKYILSPYDIEGLVKIREPDNNGKSIYLNPYAFPLAFTYKDTEYTPKNTTNPFEYQNELYRQLFGLTENLYTPVKYNVQVNDDGYGAQIQLDMPDDSSKLAVYGSVPWEYGANSAIYINGEFITDYACWLSPTVFYIPNDANQSCEMEVKTDADNFNWDMVQFYSLNLNVLSQYAKIANSQRVDTLSVENGLVTASISSTQDDERLFMSIPVDDGWNITLNGKKAEVESIGDCLYSIKITNGTNNIVLKYHIRYLKIGILISCMTVFGIIVMKIMRFKRKNSRSGEKKSI